MKRLVFCFDGTWQKLTQKYPTNVALTAETVLPLAADGVAQPIFYDEGVGTDPRGQSALRVRAKTYHVVRYRLPFVRSGDLMVRPPSPLSVMKIQIVVDGRIVSTQSDVDTRKLAVEDVKRRVLKVAMESRQLRISEALRARIVVSEEEQSVASPTTLWQQAAALSVARGKRGSQG